MQALRAVKGNRQTLHRKVKAVFDAADGGDFNPEVEDGCETVERNGGRRERRICTMLGGPGLGEQIADPEAWPGLRSLIRVQVERLGPRGGRQRSVLLHLEPACTAPLDVQFRKEDCHMCTGNSTRTRPSGCCATASDTNPGSWPPYCPETDFAFALGWVVGTRVCRSIWDSRPSVRTM